MPFSVAPYLTVVVERLLCKKSRKTAPVSLKLENEDLLMYLPLPPSTYLLKNLFAGFTGE
jgi:hypothetical protein